MMWRRGVDHPASQPTNDISGITAAEIEEGYRLILGREPESRAAVESHLHFENAQRFYTALLHSEEFLQRLVSPEELARRVLQPNTLSVAATRMGPMVVQNFDSVISAALLRSGDSGTDEIGRACEFVASQRGGVPVDWDTFVDVGANMGAHTLRALTSFGFHRAICIEPDDVNFTLLEANLALNQLSDRTIRYHRGASNRPGVGSLRRSPCNSGDHRLMSSRTAGVHSEDRWKSQAAQLITLDQVVSASEIDPARSLIWIDTQGHECAVLAGMPTLLQQGVAVAFEFWPYGWRESEASPDDLFNKLDGYRVFDIYSPDFVEVDQAVLEARWARDIAAESIENSPHTMLLALPATPARRGPERSPDANHQATLETDRPPSEASMNLRKLSAAASEFYWYHQIELADGVTTDGDYEMSQYLPYFHFPADMTGMRVLDVGRASGYFAFEFERRGADVTATEIESFLDWDFVGGEPERERKRVSIGDVQAFTRERIRGAFDFAHQTLGSKVKPVTANVYDISPDTVGSDFNLILAGSVTSHLRDPIRALERLRSVIADDGVCVVSAPYIGVDESLPLAAMVGTQDSDRRSWWVVNATCLTELLHCAGFSRVEIVDRFDLTMQRREAGVFPHVVAHARP